MFSRKEQLIQKTSPEGVGRYDFLKLLLQEFRVTQSHENKRQVLANLANFAYDPINFKYLRELQVLDVFLEQLTQGNEELLQLAIAGLCNLSSDPENRDYIIRKNGVVLVSEQLLHKNEEIALNSLTCLIFLITSESQPSITTPGIINKALHYKNSCDARFRNLGTLFLDDYCTPEQILYAEKASSLPVLDIPLPGYYATS